MANLWNAGGKNYKATLVVVGAVLASILFAFGLILTKGLALFLVLLVWLWLLVRFVLLDGL